MSLSNRPLNPTYEQRVKHQMKRYEKLRDRSLASELRTVKAYKQGLLFQLADINISINALDRMIRRRRAKKAADQGRAS